MPKLSIPLPPPIDNSDFNNWITQVTQYLRDFLGTTDWVAVAFENSWANYSSTYNEAAYCKDGMGFVHLRGLVKDGVDASVIFTLPAGYRPSKQEIFTVISNDILGRVDVLADGKVQGVEPTSPTFVSLDGITFYAG